MVPPLRVHFVSIKHTQTHVHMSCVSQERVVAAASSFLANWQSAAVLRVCWCVIACV